VSLVRNSLFPYLLVSTIFHLVLVFTWGSRPVRPAPMEEILVKLLPPAAPQERPAPRAATPRTAKPAPQPPKQLARDKPTPAELPPGKPAKIDRPGAEAPSTKYVQPTEPENKTVDKQNESNFETSDNGRSIFAQRSPTLNDLMPPVVQPSSPPKPRSTAEAIRLDSRDPKYSEYLKRVKQALDLAWYDPTVAKSVVKPFGIDAKLVVRFLPNDKGEIEELYLLRTSGYAMLDQEAIRVISAAAPYFGRPPRDGNRPIDVTFVYEKNSTSYNFTAR
jgi:TonB family protein